MTQDHKLLALIKHSQLVLGRSFVTTTKKANTGTFAHTSMSVVSHQLQSYCVKLLLQLFSLVFKQFIQPPSHSIFHHRVNHEEQMIKQCISTTVRGLLCCHLLTYSTVTKVSATSYHFTIE